MKKCPFCKADIEENARFCLYCMNSLDEKQIITVKNRNKKGWIIVLSALVALVAIALCVAFMRNGSAEDDNSIAESSVQEEGSDNSQAVVYEDMSHIFTYRDAVPQDDYHGSVSKIEDGIVITGVTQARDDGLYIIPESIDGKKVVAIGEYAFYDENIRDSVVKVVIPETVKTLHSYAFYNCLNMTDAYILTDALGGSNALFFRYKYDNTPITVHCSAECSDRDFRTYKALCEFYEYGTFVEWNGGEL